MGGWSDLSEWVAPVPDEEELRRLQTKVCPSCGREFEGFFVLCPTDQLTLTDVPQPQGTLAKRYECLRKIGVGNLFDVYDGKDNETEDPVIIKVLRRDFECDQRAMQNFEREQMIASVVKHKNIGSTLAFGALPDQYTLRPYTVTEKVKGRSLADAITEWGACSLEMATEIMQQICQAFEAAHPTGAVHSDFKSSNVYISLVDGKPDVKVVDFAVSKRSFPGRDDTRYGAGSSAQSLSSAAYTAPELNKGSVPSQASDIYAMGCLFYELLTGKPPFTGSNAFELAFAHDKDEVAPLPESIPEPLRKAVMTSLAKVPDERFKTVTDFKNGLETKSGASA
ncbi:MAG TPA: serine/threonine-protein kinase [Planktothrix sp.]